MEKLNSVQKILLEQLSMSLFHSSVHIVDDVDWKTVCDESLMQAVSILASQSGTDAIPDAVKAEWEKQNRQILTNNIRVDYEHSELHEILSDAGIPYVILKGSVSAEYYPVPIYRTMGDVDFLIRKDDVALVSMLLQENGFSVQPSNHECELAFHRDDSVWELHWRVNGIPGGEVGAKIQSYLEDIIDTAIFTDNENGGYMRPSEFHHGLVMLLHVARHMVTGGIGLRHLCDWAVCVAKIGDDFPALFEEKLKKVGLWHFAQLLTQLSVVYLGCPEQCWTGEQNPELLEQLMLDVFAGGNFGHKDPKRADASRFLTSRDKGGVNDDSILKQMLLSANELVRRHLPSAERNVFLYPIGWCFFGLRYLIRMIRGKRPKIPVGKLMENAEERRGIYRELRLYETDD